MKIHCMLVLLPVFLLLAGCSSTDGEKSTGEKSVKQREPGESTWKKFMAKEEDKERKFHRMDSQQLDNFEVYPWRDGGRRSERIYERRDKSVFTDGWW